MIEKSISSPSTATQHSVNKMPEKQAGDIFPIVGIGAFSGGLRAFIKLFKILPTDTGMAFVLIQHLDSNYISLLPELITCVTPIPIIEVHKTIRVKPNHIYIMPPNHSLILVQGALHLISRPNIRSMYLPIDDFLHSLAQDQQNTAIGIILSGTSSDGTFGIQAIKTVGGITFAQSEDSAEYDDIPHSVIAAGHVDFVLSPEEIAQKLAQIAHHPYLCQEPPDANKKISGMDSYDITKILILLYTHTNIDFTYYEHKAIWQRIRRRMVLQQLDKTKSYARFLQAHPEELDALSQDIMINLNGFFRGAENFETLKNEVFPHLMQENSSKRRLCVWIPACSTGEEAYSVAIALFEFLDDQVNTNHIQVFASDIDKQAIDKARQGIYPQSICKHIGSERLQRFFIKTTSGYQICKSIRDICTFAVQNVATDPPCSYFDLICCRNLLIYLDITIKKKILQAFHYALKPNCFLMLGMPEAIDSESKLFFLINKKNKIYIRKSLESQSGFDFPTMAYTPRTLSTPHSMAPAATSIQRAAENLILDQYGPSGVIIDQNLQILYFHGQSSPYIDSSKDNIHHHLFEVAHQEIIPDLRMAVHQAIRKHCNVRREGIRIRHNNDDNYLNLQVIPLISQIMTTSAYLVLFESDYEISISPIQSQVEKNRIDTKNRHLQDNQHKWLIKQRNRQFIIKKQEKCNQELQCANEELMIITQEYAGYSCESNRIHNNLISLLTSIDTAIVILHENLCVKYFTPAAKQLLHLADTDIGRSICSIHIHINTSILKNRIKQVFKTGLPQSFQTQNHSGRWYNFHLCPYKIRSGDTNDVMISINIDNLKKTQP
ncbi:CheR family methyltransferase [Nitrosomonas cryotolerans]|uniref:Two-component system, chemotaxis family, CheB/CheR fusion protein n=1 Tax=Nitrosomonas cryotolerans ATCC 49181 TaxID=1131553 RepID=A0A1N6J2C3_9PROT|nr:CheR family methyltransferase [Nitrosomonas cryotolerans]SIO38430.1 two-component system, chemotaxis family, CheB/CheR fusion protein [Nitrosomonas cryotolerans ATCC 49181]